jgi:hypothetical protein
MSSLLFLNIYISVLRILAFAAVLTTNTFSHLMSYPNTKAVPADGAVRPVRMLNSVVLPAPLWPRIAVIWPS